MSIDYTRFNNGDEIAITLVGTYVADRGDLIVRAEGARGSSILNHSGVLSYAVDAYRVEPVILAGQLYADGEGILYRGLSDAVVCALTGENSTVCFGGALYRSLPRGLHRVKVVPE